MRIAISGVNRGIGEAITRAALDSGDEVVGFGRSAPLSHPEHADRFTFVRCDMADHPALEAACSGVGTPLDVLICNAATFANGAGAIEWFHPAAVAECARGGEIRIEPRCSLGLQRKTDGPRNRRLGQ